MKLSTRIGIVAFTLGSCVLAAVLQIREASHDSPPASFELFETVQTHLLALRAQHYQQAYLQVSGQSTEHGSLEAFVESARGSFPAVRQALRWEFGMVTDTEAGSDLEVRFFLPGGNSLLGVFSVVRENRAWKIDHFRHTTPTEARSLTGLRL